MTVTRDDIGAVGEIVCRVLGAPPEEIERIPTHEDNRVYRAARGDGVFFFKSEPGDGVAVSAWTYSRAAAAGVPVPEVLEVDTSGERWPEPFMVMAGCPGVPADSLSDPRDVARVAAEAGEAHRTLHSVVLQGFGYIDPHAGAGVFEDHGRLIRGFASWGLEHLTPIGMFEPEVVERVDEIVRRHEELAPPPHRGVLVHGDSGLDHVFCDPNTLRVTGLIDFEPKSADPAIDIAVFGYHHPAALPAFLEGYRPQIPDLDSRSDLYRMTRALGCARWNHERGFPHTQDLAAVRELSARLHRRLQ